MDNMDPLPPCKSLTAEDEDVITKLNANVIPIGVTTLFRQKTAVKMHIDGAVGNMNKS